MINSADRRPIDGPDDSDRDLELTEDHLAEAEPTTASADAGAPPSAPDDPSPARHDLLDALTALHRSLTNCPLPLDILGVEKDREIAQQLRHQLEDHLIPRLEKAEAPLVAVVGGSTGAGKSTLINSILGEDLCTTGVLRPTTRSPVLIHHPDDTHWFEDSRILPRLARVIGPVPEGSGAQCDTNTIGTLRLAETSVLPPGLALIDAPDIDSLVDANRELARELLSAADLWVFVTTAARYADAVPWDLLNSASDRNAAVAMVLNRVPQGSMHEVRQDLADRLETSGLAEAPLFAFAEEPLKNGRITPQDVVPLAIWLRRLAEDAEAKQQVIVQTLTGAVAGVVTDTATLLDSATKQAAGQEQLHVDVDRATKSAIARLNHALVDGAVLRGEVLTRWHDFLGTAHLFRALDSSLSKLRDKLTSKIMGRKPPEESLRLALHSGICSVVVAHTELAAELTEERWRVQSFGRTLLAEYPQAKSLPPDALADAERMVRDWQRGVTEMVTNHAGAKHTMVRVLSLGVNAISVVLMMVVFAGTAFIPTGAEVATGAAAAATGQRLLEAIFGESAVRSLAHQAAEDLRKRAEEFISTHQSRYHHVLAETGVDENLPTVLSGIIHQMKAEQS